MDSTAWRIERILPTSSVLCSDHSANGMKYNAKIAVLVLSREVSSLHQRLALQVNCSFPCSSTCVAYYFWNGFDPGRGC